MRRRWFLGASVPRFLGGEERSNTRGTEVPRHRGTIACALLFVVACHPQDDRTAYELTGGDARKGREVIARYGCGGCHEIPGVDNANGLIGPSLAKIADRATLAGQLPNHPDNMIKWIRQPQSAEPNSLMPNMHVTDKDARDIAAYLYTLRADR